MKRVIKKNLVIAALMFSSILSVANEVHISSKDKVTNVSFKNVKEGSVLTIKDGDGSILYSETIKKNGVYKKGFDLTALPKGTYFFELEKDVAITMVPFIVSDSSVSYDSADKKVINKPVIIDKKNLVIVSKLTLDNKPVDVMIYNEDGNLIFNEEFEGKQSIERVYDFSKSTKGNYRIVVIAEERQFSKTVKI